MAGRLVLRFLVLPLWAALTGILGWLYRNLLGGFADDWLSGWLKAETGVEQAQVIATIAPWLLPAAGSALLIFLAYRVGRVSGALLETADARRDENASPGSAPAASGGPRRERIFVPDTVTPSTLVAPFRGHVERDARAQVAKYLGCWLKVSGEVYQLASLHAGGVQIAHRVHFMEGPLVFLRFGGEEARRASLFGKGAAFTAQGRIQHMAYGCVVLADCELLD